MNESVHITDKKISGKKEEEKFHIRITMRIIDRIEALYFLLLSWKEMYLRRMTSNVEDEESSRDEEPLNLSSIPLINRQQ